MRQELPKLRVKSQLNSSNLKHTDNNVMSTETDKEGIWW